MNLDRARTLLGRLPIKSRQTGRSVPFIFNANQTKAFDKIKAQYDRLGWVRVISVKARRVGMSSLFDGLLFTQGAAKAQSHLRIIAQLKTTTETGLFRVPRDLGKALNDKIPGSCEVMARNINFMHSTGESLLDLATAGTTTGGRGDTLAGLHLSEAAYFPSTNSFTSVLSAVADAPDTMVAIESTANGRVGVGEDFYDFWNDAVAGINGYVPIFCSWLDDPDCIRSEDEALDAPANDLERELMKKPYRATRAQIAWMRLTKASKCKNEDNIWLQEYPHDPAVAFVATGDPAFPREEIVYANSTKKDPIFRGRAYRKKVECIFDKSPLGDLVIWEYPKPKCYYYIGGDAAAGLETGDFTTLVCWNGTTGKQAFRWAAKAHPEEMAEMADLLGRHFNNAMVNIELTGNLGRWAQKKLRDEYYYPNIYVWRGKDARKPGKDKGNAHGWETTGYSRGLMFDAYRESLRAGVKGIPGGIEVYDEELIRQMDLATLGGGFRWEVRKGHDDVLLAGMLCIVTRAQYPPPNIMSYSANVLETKESKHSSVQSALKAQPNLRNALQSDLNFILRKDRQRQRNVLGVV